MNQGRGPEVANDLSEPSFNPADNSGTALPARDCLLWIGNTQDVAEAHYIQEQTEFRQVAAQKPTTETEIKDEHQRDFPHHSDKNGANVMQNPVQKIEEPGGTEQNSSVFETSQID